MEDNFSLSSPVASTANNTCLNEVNPCPFRVINGVVLLGISGTGFFLTGTVIFMLLFQHVKLPGNKGVYILNVAMNDVMMAIIGCIRGSFYLKNYLIDPNGESNMFCDIYAILSEPFKSSLSLVLIPLTIDRFIAIFFPTRYSKWVTSTVTWTMVLLSWCPGVIICLLDLGNFFTGNLELHYMPKELRCTFSFNRRINTPKIFLAAPTAFIGILYLLMLYKIIRNNIPASKVFITSTAIIATSLVTTLPELIIHFDKNWTGKVSYEVFHVLLVTMYYINPVCNPIIYLCSNPLAQGQVIKRNVSVKL